MDVARRFVGMFVYMYVCIVSMHVNGLCLHRLVHINWQ